jgi:uncharacterized protein (TIGR03435 family)
MRGRMICGVVCGLLLPIVVAGQTRPEFEVASVRPSAEQTGQVDLGVHVSGSQVRITGMSLRDYIRVAYRVSTSQVIGPDWIAQERFDLAAKIPDGVSPRQVPEMLQALLADRFQLKFHREARELPVFALGVGKNGPRLQESAANATTVAEGSPPVNIAASGSTAGVTVDLGGGSLFSLANNRLEIKRMTMKALADMLTRFVDRTVVDMTALTGTYDLTLDLAPEDYTAMLIRSALNSGVVLSPRAQRALDLASGDPLSSPLQKFGLTWEARKAPLDVIVVDSMQKAPAEN